MMIGYARVSKIEQDTELQMNALRKAGVRKVYQEKRSGGRMTHRVELLAMLEQLREGDQVIVYKLDRLARSVRDLLNIVDRIETAGATFRSITEVFDTSTPAGKMAFHMLGAVAEFERNLIRERSLAGVEVARAAGVRFGRAPALKPHQELRLVEQWKSEKYSKAELGKMHGVSISTVKRTLWKHGHDTITEAHAKGMLPPVAPAKKAARTRQ